MADQEQEIEKLLEELQALHHQIGQLTEENSNLLTQVNKGDRIEHELGERVKELNCLYGISRLVDRFGGSLKSLLQGMVDLLPGSWQYPEITCGRVIFEGCEYVTANFHVSRWKQAADIKVSGEVSGVVEVYYLEKRRIIDEGPFLKEERLLLNAVSERLGKIIERVRAENPGGRVCLL